MTRSRTSARRTDDIRGRVIPALAGAAVFFFALSAAPLPARAVTVGPTKIEYKVDPGAVVNGNLFLRNEDSVARTFYASFEKFTEVNGEKRFLPSEGSELADWFRMPEEVSLGAGEQKEIPFTVEVPANAPPGGHFAVIWWGTAPPGGNDNVSIVTRAGILVYLQVSGEVSERGEVVRFAGEDGTSFVFELPERFAVEFRNAGNTYLKPRGEIAVKNIFGSPVASFAVNGKEVIMFPGNTQALDVAAKFDRPPFAFGLYRAELSLRWGDGQSDSAHVLRFFVFPWKAALSALLILLLLFFAVTRGIRRYNRWVIAQAMKGKE